MNMRRTYETLDSSPSSGFKQGPWACEEPILPPVPQVLPFNYLLLSI